MRALVEEMQVDIAYRREKAIGIAPLPGCATREMEAQPVAKRKRRAGNERAEQPTREPLQRHTSAIGEQRLRTHGVRVHRANHYARLPSCRSGMSAEDVMRIVVIAGEQAIELAGIDTGECVGRGGRCCHVVSSW